MDQMCGFDSIPKWIYQKLLLAYLKYKNTKWQFMKIYKE